MENIRLVDLVHVRNLEGFLICKEIDIVRGVDGLGHAVYLMSNYDRSVRYLSSIFRDTVPGLPLLNSESSSMSSTLQQNKYLSCKQEGTKVTRDSRCVVVLLHELLPRVEL